MVKRQSKPSTTGREPTLRATFSRAGGDGFSGYVYDESDPSRRFVVELLLDGFPVRIARADAYANELALKGVGDGCYGFSFTLPDAVLADAAVAEARLANSGAAVGTPILLQSAAEPTKETGDTRGFGSVGWLGGLRFQGWLRGDPTATPTIRATIDGEVVAETRATRWSHIGGFDNANMVRAFDLYLPAHFADGRVRRASFVTDDGQQISASAVAFVAFPDGVEQFFSSFAELASEQFRGRMLERLLPMSAPFSDYATWCERFSNPPGEAPTPSLAIVLVGSGDERRSLRSVEQQHYPDWVAAALPATRDDITFDPPHLRQFLTREAADCDLIVFAMAGTVFSKDALRRVAAAFGQHPDAEVAYGDLDIASDDGRAWPLALPAFDYERLLEQGYCAHLFAMTRDAAMRALGAGATNLYRLLNSVLDKGSIRDNSAKILHIPTPIGSLPDIDLRALSRTLASATAAHLEARGVGGEVTPSRGDLLPSVRVLRTVRRRPSTTVIIPVRNRKALLKECLESIGPAVSAARADVMIVDNDSSDPDMLAYLDQLKNSRILVVRALGPFNFARLNNIAAEKSGSEFLCLLNNDIKALDSTWLRDMQSRMEEPDVGAVGALLLWPSGVVQHGGVVIGPSFAATHAFNDRIQDDPGYGDMLRVARECSAVTAACLLTRRSDYLAVGGMDEARFPVNFNDVDYCLKLRSAGKRIVFTPHARLIHHESASRGADRAPDKASRFDRELRNLRAKWGECLLADPYYSPVLSLDPIPFSALAWPPRDRSVRQNQLPAAVTAPPGF